MKLYESLLELAPPAAEEPPPVAGRDRFRFWRSPRGQPRFSRPALLILGVIAIFDYSWRLRAGTGNAPAFYSAAIRTMSSNWRLFLFGGFDTSGLFTVDKLPGSFWIDALAVRMFGFNVWAVFGPQSLEGLGCVLLLHRLVSRHAGTVAALAACAVFVTTPVTTAVFRGNVPDALSTLLIILTAGAVLQGITRDAGRPMVLAGVWLGLAFQAKMGQAWVLLPVVAMTCVLCGRGTLLRRLQLFAATAATTVVVSLSWMVVAQTTPARSRPYFDGSTHNSIFEQVFLFNGFGRLTGSAFGLPGVSAAVPPPSPPWKLLFGPYAAGVSWLIPLAAISAFVMVRSLRLRHPADPLRALVMFCLGWLAIYFVLFSVVGHIQTYYTAVLAPPLSVLVGVAAVWGWRALTAGSAPHRLVPALLLASWGYSLVLLTSTGWRWLWVAALQGALGIGAALALRRAVANAVDDPGHRTRRWRPTAVLLGGTLVLVPAVASAAMVGNAADPYALAFNQHSVIGPEVPSADLATQYARGELPLLRFLEGHRTMFLLGTFSSATAARFVAATGQPVLAIGGFTGSMPQPSLDAIEHDVAGGQVRFFIVPIGTDPRLRWLNSHCGPAGAAVPSLGPAVAGSSPIAPVRLVDCARRRATQPGTVG